MIYSLTHTTMQRQYDKEDIIQCHLCNYQLYMTYLLEYSLVALKNELKICSKGIPKKTY